MRKISRTASPHFVGAAFFLQKNLVGLALGSCEIWLFWEIRKSVNKQSRHNMTALQSMFYILSSKNLFLLLATCY